MFQKCIISSVSLERTRGDLKVSDLVQICVNAFLVFPFPFCKFSILRS